MEMAKKRKEGCWGVVRIEDGKKKKIVVLEGGGRFECLAY